MNVSKLEDEGRQIRLLGIMRVTLGRLPEQFVSDLFEASAGMVATSQVKDAERRIGAPNCRQPTMSTSSTMADWRKQICKDIDTALSKDKHHGHSSYSGARFVAGFTGEDVANISRLRALPCACLCFSDEEWSLSTDQIRLTDISLKSLPQLQRICETLHSHPLADHGLAEPRPTLSSMEF